MAQGGADPSHFAPRAWRRFGRFLGLLSVAAVLLGAAFLLTYRFMDLHGLSNDAGFLGVMLRLYAATLVVASLGTWWIVLSQERQEQSERELLESIQHLEQTRRHLVESEKLASLGGLVAGVAHEINTPAGILVSSASYLQDRTETVQQLATDGVLDAARQQRYLRDADASARLMLSNAQRIAKLVQNFKQIAVDRIVEAPQAFDLRELLQSTVLTLQPKVDEAGVAVHIDAPADIRLQSYPLALAQVLTNLAMNSLQHGFDPVRPGAAIHLRATLEPGGEEVRIDYSDNGRGVEPALEGRVFDPFFTTRRMLGGSGLGLYIVHQIVTRQLGGSVTLQGHPGEGAHFMIQFPTVARHGPDVGRMLAALPRSST